MNELLKRPTKEDIYRTSAQFAALLNRQNHIEDHVVKCVRHLFMALNSKDLSQLGPSWEKSRSTLKYDNIDGFLDAICQTAAYVISSYHGGRPDDVSVNIKLFGIRGDPPHEDVVYLVQARSPGSDLNRDKADDDTKRKEFRVHDNMLYSALLGTNSQNIVDGVCVVDNIDDYIKLRIDTNEARTQAVPRLPAYKEPSESVKAFYNSCMVVPISGSLISVPQISPKDRTELWASLAGIDEKHVIGIICIDSMKVGYFDRTHDVQVMKQLALHAFSAVRAYYETIALKDTVGAFISVPTLQPLDKSPSVVMPPLAPPTAERRNLSFRPSLLFEGSEPLHLQAR